MYSVQCTLVYLPTAIQNNMGAPKMQYSIRSINSSTKYTLLLPVNLAIEKSTIMLSKKRKKTSRIFCAPIIIFAYFIYKCTCVVYQQFEMNTTFHAVDKHGENNIGAPKM